MNLKNETLVDSDSANQVFVDAHSVRFDLLFKAFPAPTYIWRHSQGDFILLDCNDAGGKNLGGKFTRLPHLGMLLSDLDDQPVVEDVHQCYREKRTFTRERPGHRLWNIGEAKDLFFNYAFVDPDLVLVSFNDVTQINSTLELLKRLSSAVEQTADAVFITNRSGVIEYVNPAFEQVTGYSRSEALGQTPRILKSGDMAPGYYQQLWQTILRGEPFQSQTVNHRRDGSRLIVEQTITPIKDQSGQVTHFVSLLKDMTDRIQLQEKETEHRLAGKIQQGLFPRHAPRINGYDIAGSVFPANNTSGDCFDYVPMLGNTTGIVVGDVCGHGMGPALIMASARAYLRSIARFVPEPQKALQELHSQIQADLAQVGFITMFLARLDPLHHEIRYANAGNWPAYVFNPDGHVTHELRTDGYPIGVSPQLTLRPNEAIALAPGSMVVFITDGIPEARDPSERQFGIERLLAFIHNHREASAGEIVHLVREEVQRYIGSAEQTDDQTIVICKRVK
jgi:PAS domain S-box-containing protein